MKATKTHQARHESLALLWEDDINLIKVIPLTSFHKVNSHYGVMLRIAMGSCVISHRANLLTSAVMETHFKENGGKNCPLPSIR